MNPPNPVSESKTSEATKPDRENAPLRLDPRRAELTEEELATLKRMRERCERHILSATTLAASGHPGGSLSALDALLVLYGMIRRDPRDPDSPERDRVVVSIGHISPALYSVLAEYGYFDAADFLIGFRRLGSGFPGHVESVVPGVEWNTGNLGQGLSAGVGMAQVFKMDDKSNRVICLLGDGELQKGQIVEAMRYASKYRLDNLIALVDRNHLQICGSTEDVMPQSIRKLFESQGWRAIQIEDGHDHNAIFKALRTALRASSGAPTALIARTIMGKGVSFMENAPQYHGAALTETEYSAAMKELELDNDLDRWRRARSRPIPKRAIAVKKGIYPKIEPGEAELYSPETLADCRSAYGKALLSLGEANNVDGARLIVGISCDLEGSVKMTAFKRRFPDCHFEAGIQEHHAATMAGAISREGKVPFFSTFGVFAVSEVYNQNRLSDFNGANLKIVATHVGLNVGEDGATHQCIDYLGLLRNLFRFSVFMPADPNQCDRIVRLVATTPGNFFVGMGRSKTPVITKEDGSPFFDLAYRFTPGRADTLRRGSKATIVTYGSLVPAAISAHEALREEKIDVTILNMASLAPLDKESLLEAAKRGPILTVEDHHIDTGLGAMTATLFADEGIQVKMARLGVRDYAGSGSPAELYMDNGLDAQSIAERLRRLIG